MSTSAPEVASQIVEFWFSPRVRSLWFKSTPAFDQEIRERFEGLFREATSGRLDDWTDSPQGALALIIVLDQFPRNMYRGRPESFASGQTAVRVAAQTIATGFDRQLSNEQKAFMYLPYMHSEDPVDQARSVELYGQAGLEGNLAYARQHRELIERFGRFPHRNAILGRASTAAEIAYLEGKDAFHG